MSYCFGIDIGGTTVKCGLFTTEGVLLEKWEIKTRTEENGKAILPDVAETILKKMEEKGIEKTEVTGVGVGVPGPVVKEREVQVAVNLHWGYTMLADDLEKLLDQIPVKVGNDANVAALGEMWRWRRYKEPDYGYTGNRRRRRYYCGWQDCYRSTWCRWRNRTCLCGTGRNRKL